MGNLRLLDFQYVKVPKGKISSTIRVTSKVCNIYMDFHNLQEFLRKQNEDF